MGTLLRAYDEQVRPAEASMLPEGVYAETDGPVTRIVGQFRGFITGPADLGVSGDDLDALIARQRDFFAARGEAVEWKTRGHDRPQELPERLAAAAFVPEPTETVVIGPALGIAAQTAGLPDGVVLRQVTADVDMHRIAAMESRVWGEDQSWLADDGQVVAAAWLTWGPGSEFAGLWGGTTRAEWRRRGIYRALVARRAVLAVAVGVRFLHVDASDESRPILEHLGFTAVTTTTPYVWSPG